MRGRDRWGAACLVAVLGCGPATPRIENRAAVSPGRTEPDSIVPVPDEPWYRDRTEGRRDECEASLPTVPPAHFPAPFEACDPRAESYASPPGGNELHFHYRFFSAALTTARRTHAPGVCCYMIWEFPHYE